MSVTSTVEKVLANAEKLKKSGGNEANTKVLLIEPMLSALGWDTGDLDQVEREYRVFDGTSLDYALRIGGEPKLFVEAKAISMKLDDKSFISQAVNYANNEGVVWCVLTNGLSYRVYKTNEPVAMDAKLLFEVDLTKAANGSATEVADSLALIGRAALDEGQLEEWGERVFTDKRVRDVLTAIADKPPVEFLSLINGKLGKPEILNQRLRESLARILDVGEGPSGPPAPKKGKGQGPPTPPKPPGKELSLGHHTDTKPAGIVDLFERVDEYSRSLGADISRRIRKFYVGYFRGKRSFCTVEVQRQRLILYLNLDPTTATPWNDTSMRDVRQIGHYGMGDTEFSLKSADQIEEAKALIKLAYERTG